MKKDLDYYMSLPYRLEIVEDKEEGGFAIRCPELVGCITCADTIEEGMQMIQDAKMCWFSACIEDGIPIPEPDMQESVSGQFRLRIPKSLHRDLIRRAREEGISMNQYCIYLLSSRLNSTRQQAHLLNSHVPQT